MPNSPGPTQILINSHSAYGFHKSALNANEWHSTPDVGGAGAIEAWDATLIDTDDMVVALVTLLAPFFPASYHFDNYIVFTYATPDADPVPVASNPLTVVGTSAAPGWSKATQTTLSFRTDLFGIAKIVLLDVDSQDSFDKTVVVPPATPLEALVTEFTLDTNGWSGRDGGRPDTYISATTTLNEKLRREYRMA
jgi:hypothetical protein